MNNKKSSVFIKIISILTTSAITLGNFGVVSVSAIESLIITTNTESDEILENGGTVTENSSVEQEDISNPGDSGISEGNNVSEKGEILKEISDLKENEANVNFGEQNPTNISENDISFTFISAENEFIDSGIKYIENDDGKTVKLVEYDGSKSSEELIIPQTVMNGNKLYNVTSIGSNAFKDCSSLISVWIPNSVTSIGDYAFKDCSSLTSINVADGNENYLSEDGILFNKDQTTIIKFPASKLENYYEIPRGVTSIGNSAFNGCNVLTNVTIPDGVTSIGSFAFKNCSSLKSVEIPNSILYLGDEAFAECSSLKYLLIPRCSIDGTGIFLHTLVSTGDGLVYTTAEFRESSKWGYLGLSKSVVKIIPDSPAMVTGLKWKLIEEGIELRWGADNDANGYILTRKDQSGDEVTLGTGLIEPKYTDDSVSVAQSYTYSVIPYVNYNNSPAEDDPFGAMASSGAPSSVEAVFYRISIENIENGAVILDKNTALEGQAITLTVTPNKGYKFNTDSLKINGGSVTADEVSDSIFTFAMPDENANISAEFILLSTSNYAQQDKNLSVQSDCTDNYDRSNFSQTSDVGTSVLIVFMALSSALECIIFRKKRNEK